MVEADDIRFVVLDERWIVDATGRVLPVVRGGADPDDPPDDDPDDDPDDPPPPGKTFSQEEVDAIVQRRTAKAERAAQRKLEDELGMSPAEAKAALDEIREREQEQLTEVERREREAEERERKAEAREAAAVERERKTTVKEALRDAQARPQARRPRRGGSGRRGRPGERHRGAQGRGPRVVRLHQ
jgi:hypothetical protein